MTQRDDQLERATGLTHGAFARALHTAALATGQTAQAITGPKRGAPPLQRARALTAYLASTEAQLTDTEIARHLNRDRTAVTHMLRVIETIRDHPDIDAWLDDVARRAIAPPPLTPELATLFHTLQEGSDGTVRVPSPKRPTTRTPPRVLEIVTPIASAHGVDPAAVLRHPTPTAIRHEAWRTLAQHTSPAGQRIFTSRRIAAFAGVSASTVVRALRGAQGSDGAA